MKLRRIIEFVVGVLIALFLIRKYNDTSGSKYLIDFIMPYQPFKAIFVVVLIIISSNLIAGKPKDYSVFFILFWLSYLQIRLKRIEIASDSQIVFLSITC